MSWILLKAINGQQASGVGDKNVSVLSEMRSICEQPLYDIILMILHVNKSCVLITDQNNHILFKAANTRVGLHDFEYEIMGVLRREYISADLIMIASLMIYRLFDITVTS